MVQPTRQTIMIYDHPESKIRFLEQTLIGKDWRAILVFPDGTPKERAALAEAKQQFLARGYVVSENINEHGHHTLDIHHLGEGSKPSEILHELGLAKGIGHLITHPSIPLSSTLGMGGRAMDSIIKTARDPAHLNGIIYIAAEAFLANPFAKKKAGGEVSAKPKHILRQIGFLSFFTQSFIYLFIAKNNEETAFDEFKNKISKTVKSGGDITNVQFDEQADKPGDGIGHNIIRLMRRYPIEAGALFNNLGMVMYIAGTLKDKHYYESVMKSGLGGEAAKSAEAYLRKGTGFLGLKNAGGFAKDMRGAMTSIIAWTLMLIPPKKKEEVDEDHPSKNILGRAWDAVRQNPQVGTGLLTVASSWQRLGGAKIREKIEPGSAKNQIRGENIYLLGDLTLLFTKNDHYGKKSGNVDALAEQLADYINKMPLILGPEAQVAMVQNMSGYLLHHGLAEIKRHPKTASFTPDELKERAELLNLEVGRRVRNSYGEQMEQLGDVTAKLIAQFPSSQRSELIDALAKTLSQFPWVRATPAELKPVLETSVKRLPPSALPATHTPLTMKSIRQAIGDIVGIMPEVDDGACVALMYDALVPFTSPAALQPKATITHAQHIAPIAPQANARAHA